MSSRPSYGRLLRLLLAASVVLSATLGVAVGAPTPTAALTDTAPTASLTTTGDGGTPTPTPAPGGGAPSPTPAPGGGTVEGEPDIDVFLPQNTVSPGEQSRLAVQVTNGGSVEEAPADAPSESLALVTTARDVRVTLEEGDAPIEVRTATTGLGELPSGGVAEVGFDVVVDEDADPGLYTLPVTVSYDYTASISDGDRDDRSETDTFEVTLRVVESARFEVVEVDSDVQVGETGTVEVTFENVGEETVRDADVTFSSANADLRVDTGSQTVRFVGDWDAGEQRTVAFQATASADAAPQRYGLGAVISFTDSDGVPRESAPLSFGITLDAEQQFSLDDVSGSLRVGEDGTVTGTVTNEGPRDVENAVVRLVDEDGDVVPLRSTTVLGDLDEGETDAFSFPVRVADDAESGERQLTFVVEYVTADGDTRTSADLKGTVAVSRERDRFEVVSVDSDVPAGGTGTVGLRIENIGEEDLTDATVVVSSPDAGLVLAAGGDVTRFVGDWDAGDVRPVTFEATAADGTAGQRLTLDVRVSFTDSDGDQRQSGPLVVELRPADEQAFVVTDVTSTLRVGEEGRVSGVVRNAGPRDVDDAVLRLTDADETLDARETEAVLGTLDSGEASAFSLPISVADTAQPGSKQLTSVVEYVTTDGDRRQSDPISVIVDVSEGRDRFVVGSVASTVQAGTTGDVVLTLTNRENQTLSDARVRLTTESGQLLVGNDVEDNRFVGDWPAGEQRTVRYRVRAPNGTGDQTFAFRATVEFEDDEGQSRTSDTVSFGVTPAPEQAFGLRSVESTLRVGEEGRVVVELTNRGPRDASEIALELVSEAPNVNPTETEVSAGALAPGESALRSFPIEISENADAGPRQLTFRVRYTDDEGDRRTGDPLTTSVGVAPERDPFRVDIEQLNVTVGESATVVLTVTNTRGVPLRDIQAKAFADDPLSVADDQAFVQSLAPNESTTVQFDVSAGADAGSKTYPMSVDFLYTLPDGDQQLSDPVDIGVTVVESPDDGLFDLVVPVLGILVVVALAVWLLRRFRRRRGEEAGDEEAGDEEAGDEEAGDEEAGDEGTTADAPDEGGTTGGT